MFITILGFRLRSQDVRYYVVHHLVIPGFIWGINGEKWRVQITLEDGTIFTGPNNDTEEEALSDMAEVDAALCGGLN